MSATAILLMAIAIILVWGGLVAAIVALRTLPEPEVQVDVNGNVIDDPSLGNSIW
ncbi:MAG: methionine/alanine import family NSS transporter small subunit [Actinomycetaceae bacterium]|nr:methionine/alanine import family NSS transporter small subunit [Actinomycetaceae bacterium]